MIGFKHFLMEQEFEFLKRVQNNANFEQLKNIASSSLAKTGRYVFDERGNLHCGDAKKFCHGDIHGCYYAGKSPAAGMVYHDSETNKHYYEMNKESELGNDRSGTAAESLEKHGIEKMPKDYKHKERGQIQW